MGSLLGVGLGNALMATALAVGAAAIGRVARRPALAHGLWLIVLLKLLTPPLWTVAVAGPWREEAVEIVPERVEVVAEDLAGAAIEGVAFDLVLQEAIAAEARPSAAAVVAGWLGRNWRALVGGAWLAGSIAWLASAVTRIGRFRRVVREATPAPAAMQWQADGLARKVGLDHAPGVWLLPGAVSPLVWALVGRARLLVPRDLWETLDDDERATLLTHELAHLRRRDHWVRWVELAATALYWWCPVVWWARRELREAEEQCCDAWVVWAWPAATKAYATALLNTVDFLAETRPAVPLAASGAGHVHHLKRRVTMILSGLTPRSLSTAGRAAVVGLAALILPLAPSLAQDKPKPAEPKAEKAEKTEKVERDEPIEVIVTRALEEFDEAAIKNVLGEIELVVKDGDDDDKDDEARAKMKALKDKLKAQADAARTKARAEAAKARAEAAKARDERLAERRVSLQRTGPDAPTASKEDQEALVKAKAEMALAQEALQKAAKRLAEAQMKVGVKGQYRVEFRTSGGPDGKTVITNEDIKGEPTRRSVRVFTRDLAGPDAPKPPVPPVPPVGPKPGVTRQAKETVVGQDERMEQLEKKLDALIGELKELKKKD